MVAAAVVNAVREFLGALRLEGIDVSFGVLFGSQARGDATDVSDIDLIVVAPYYDAHRGFDDIARLWVLKAAHDWRLEPIPCGAKEWAEDHSRLIVDVARREGIVIRPLDVAA